MADETDPELGADGWFEQARKNLQFARYAVRTGEPAVSMVIGFMRAIFHVIVDLKARVELLESDKKSEKRS
jgi:hypothetical protein